MLELVAPMIVMGFIRTAADVPFRSLPDYDYRYPAGLESTGWGLGSPLAADDIHRDSTDPVVGLGVSYIVLGNSDVSMHVQIWENNIDNTLMPSGNPILELSLGEIPEANLVNLFIEFDHPIALPRDLWIAVEFEGDAGITIPLGESFSRGQSQDMILVDFNSDGIPETPLFGDGLPYYSFGMTVYTERNLPAPSAAFWLGIAALAVRRRVRDQD